MDKRSINSSPELWGGIECSLNRIDDVFVDQLSLTQHYRRGLSDIQKFAGLGIQRIRYPLIWERHQSRRNGTIDWSWAAGQLRALRDARVEPIAGLLHHGNGPAFTDLLDPSFPEHFSSYAGAVAKRFPDIGYYTPINEPLTTARFTGLYGLWYPHRRNDRDFAVILLHQMKAIILAMEEIRRVNPNARLLQTEDLSKTYSTPFLRYQADFENERRWLTFDLLCGNFKPGHALWDFFCRLALPDALMHFFEDHYCPPDIIGADYYLTSERFLDEHTGQYPRAKRGGNHQHAYADVEAVRVDHPHPWGLKVLVRECRERFQLPVAITEVHVNGESDDQIRWFREVFDTAGELNAEGIPVVAVTAWSLLGAFGWSSLLTAPEGDYEAGAFDIRTGEAMPTGFAHYLKAFSRDPAHHHPALQRKGWWQAKDRCFYNVDPACREVDLINPALAQKAV